MGGTHAVDRGSDVGCEVRSAWDGLRDGQRPECFLHSTRGTARESDDADPLDGAGPLEALCAYPTEHGFSAGPFVRQEVLWSFSQAARVDTTVLQLAPLYPLVSEGVGGSVSR